MDLAAVSLIHLTLVMLLVFPQGQDLEDMFRKTVGIHASQSQSTRK